VEIRPSAAVTFLYGRTSVSRSNSIPSFIVLREALPISSLGVPWIYRPKHLPLCHTYFQWSRVNSQDSSQYCNALLNLCAVPTTPYPALKCCPQDTCAYRYYHRHQFSYQDIIRYSNARAAETIKRNRATGCSLNVRPLQTVMIRKIVWPGVPERFIAIIMNSVVLTVRG
jgi:hypothetical protein